MDTKWTHEDNKKSRNLVYQVFRDYSSDLDWIQTSNLLSRNQMRYSVAPRGRFEGANIILLLVLKKYIFKKNNLFSRV